MNGTRLPPLMLTEDEALAVTLGLMALALYLNQLASRPAATAWRWAWVLCLVLGTLGPNIEFFRQFHRNWIVAAQRAMSKRAGSTVTQSPGSHAVYLSQPEAVASIIRKAARGVGDSVR